jgi:hypothetical protein
VTTVAGVVVQTVPGAAPRVAARLLHRPGFEPTGGDGKERVAAVVTAESGEALEAIAEALLRDDADVLGVFPTFVGEDDEAAV